MSGKKAHAFSHPCKQPLSFANALLLDRLKEANVKNVSLTDFDCISQVAADEGYIAPEDVKRLIKFRNDPSDESWIGEK